MAKTEDTVLISYYLDGLLMFLTLNRCDVAPLLKQFGLIKRYEGSGESLKMYGLTAPKFKKAGFTSDWKETQVVCDDIKIFESDVIHLIACEEYEKIVELMRGTRLFKRTADIQCPASSQELVLAMNEIQHALI